MCWHKKKIPPDFETEEDDEDTCTIYEEEEGE